MDAVQGSESLRPTFAVLVLNWNDHTEVVDCLRSVEATSYTRLRIYIIDNGSRPESVAYMRPRLPGAIILENGRNLGFSGGFNVGIQRALDDQADFVCVLNSDIRVSADFFDELADAFDDTGVAAAAPKELDFFQTDRLWFAGGSVSPLATRVFGFGQRDSHEFSIPGDTGRLCGAAMVFRSATLRAIGGFDERLFFTGEDQEIALRLLRADMRIRYVPSAKVWHKRGASAGGGETPLNSYFSSRNYLQVAFTYGNPLEKALAVGFFAFVLAPRILTRVHATADRRHLMGLKWALVWFLNSKRVPEDADAVELLMSRELHSKVRRTD